MKTLHELIRETTPIPVPKLNGVNGHKSARKPIDWIKLTMFALVAACLLPFSIHQWQLVAAEAHKREIHSQIEDLMSKNRPYGALLGYFKAL